MRERKSDSLEARYAALWSSRRCLEMLCENQRLEIRALLAHLRACTGDEADFVAHYCNPFGLNKGLSKVKWWKAVKRARAFLERYSPPAKERAAR